MVTSEFPEPTPQPSIGFDRKLRATSKYDRGSVEQTSATREPVVRFVKRKRRAENPRDVLSQLEFGWGKISSRRAN
jgi:hypothetical protein